MSDVRESGELVDDGADVAAAEQSPESAAQPTSGKLRDRLAGSPVRFALTLGAVTIVVLCALAAWLGYLTIRGYQGERERAAFLNVARQGAVDLTSVDYTHADADIARLLEASTGAFHDDFQKRSGPFIEEVLRTKTKTVGSVAEAAVESVEGDSAKVLVAVRVKTTRDGSPDERDKGWRMRIGVTRVGSDLKVSSVGFVP